MRIKIYDHFLFYWAADVLIIHSFVYLLLFIFLSTLLFDSFGSFFLLLYFSCQLLIGCSLLLFYWLFLPSLRFRFYFLSILLLLLKWFHIFFAPDEERIRSFEMRCGLLIFIIFLRRSFQCIKFYTIIAIISTQYENMYWFININVL